MLIVGEFAAGLLYVAVGLRTRDDTAGALLMMCGAGLLVAAVWQLLDVVFIK